MCLFLRAYYKSGAVLGAFLILMRPYDTGTVRIIIVRMRKRPQTVRYLAQSHTAKKWWNQNTNAEDTTLPSSSPFPGARSLPILPGSSHSTPHLLLSLGIFLKNHQTPPCPITI